MVFIYLFYVDFQRLQNENQALREENHTLRESNARAGENALLIFFVCNVGSKLPYAFHFVASWDLRESNARAGENMHSFLNFTFFVCNVGSKLPYAFHFVATDDSGSLQEQVKQVGTMLKTFACTWQSGKLANTCGCWFNSHWGHLNM